MAQGHWRQTRSIEFRGCGIGICPARAGCGEGGVCGGGDKHRRTFSRRQHAAERVASSGLRAQLSVLQTHVGVMFCGRYTTWTSNDRVSRMVPFFDLGTSLDCRLLCREHRLTEVPVCRSFRLTKRAQGWPLMRTMPSNERSNRAQQGILREITWTKSTQQSNEINTTFSAHIHKEKDTSKSFTQRLRD